jgi:5-(carboxyamino)imidazole ribonucleotide synthase
LQRFAQAADVITLENEFVDVQVLQMLEAQGKPVFPSALTLAQIQDKLHQKEALLGAGLAIPKFTAVQNAAEVEAFAAEHGWPLILKARRNGYDGRGNWKLDSAADIAEGFARLGAPARELMVEAFIPFEKELAVMVVRAQDGEVINYPVVETVQTNHICHSVSAPANLPNAVLERAADMARRAVVAVGGVGLFGIEMFLAENGQVLINEMAPRSHNSGHYTIEACATSQFENHLRAVLGWPLGSTELLAPAAMVNLLGKTASPAEPKGLLKALAVPNANVHIYGKRESRPGRKMGHVTVVAPGRSAEAALELAEQAANFIEF